MRKITLCVLLICVILCGCQKKAPENAESTTEPGYNGVILEAPTSASVEFCQMAPDNPPMTPEKTEQLDGMLRYYYPNAVGRYFYSVSAAGCYKSVNSLYIAPRDQGKELVITITPEEMAGNGWEAQKYYTYTDQIMDYKPDDPALWPDYPEAFSTPAFDEGHAAHQYTTQQELEAYIQQLDDADDQMYVYSAGTSAYGKNVPLVIFTTTDLSTAATLEEAAELLCENGKLTIQYQGHVHGNEPAGGEAALGMLKRLDGEAGKTLLEQVNVYVIPRVNPDGAERNTRKTVAGQVDPNRDLFKLREIEVRNIVRVAQLLEPTVVIDSHEYSVDISREEDSYADIQVSPGFVSNPQQELAKLSLDIVDGVFAACRDQGLSYKYYLNTLNSENVTTFRDYFCRLGKLTFVLESKGINYGNVTMGRRTVGHLVSAWSIMTQVAEEPQLYLDASARWEQATIEAGRTYEENDVVVLQREKSKHPEYDLIVEYFMLGTGDRKNKTVATSINDVILRSRPAPTAYVIPAGQEWTEEVLALMDLHGISYTFVPVGTQMKLQQYTGSTEFAELAAEKTVFFHKGAYVFTMAQEQAMILSLLMEPDATDMEGSTLAQQGLIPCKDGKFPLYRSTEILTEE